MAKDVAGTVYILHFHIRYKHAGHYVGWSENLNERLEDHHAGKGSRLMAVIKEAGITWELAKSWPGTRTDERRFKSYHKTWRYCPICKEA